MLVVSAGTWGSARVVVQLPGFVTIGPQFSASTPQVIVFSDQKCAMAAKHG